MPDIRPSEGFVFIVTYGRSGSTLLQTVLQTIDGYLIRGENNNVLLPLFRAARRAVTARTKHGAGEIPPHGPWYGADTMDADAFAQGVVDVFIREVLQPGAGTRVLGFKEIRFHEADGAEFADFMDFMARHFAPARFIFNMRNAQDVAKSGWWKTMDRDKVIAKIADFDALYKDYAAAHPNQCFITCYDDFNGKPEALQPLFRFLGEPFDEAHVAAVMERRLKH